ncbi:phage holin family protein [Streptomyces xanthophaeus]
MSAVGRPGHGPTEEWVGDLVSRASLQISELVREEMQLARAEMTQKGKRFGLGGGLFGAVIAALALLLPVWASALIIAALLAAVAAVMAAAGKKQIAKAGTPASEQAIDSIKADVAEIKETTQK